MVCIKSSRSLQEDGVFAKDPTLKDKLQHGPYVAAAIRMQHGWESCHTRARAFDIIEEYAALGGDGGRTEDVMRVACGLKPRDRRNLDGPEAVHLAPDEEGTSDPPEEDLGLQLVQKAIVDSCIQQGKDAFTPGMLRYLSMPVNSPNVDKSTLWKQLIEAKLMIPLPNQKSLKRGSDAAFPALSGKVALQSLFEIRPVTEETIMNETYNHTALDDFLHKHPARLANTVVINQFLSAYVDHVNPKKKGKKTFKEQAKIADVSSQANKFAKCYSIAEAMLENLRPSEDSQAGTPSRKRLRIKSSNSDTMVKVQVPYYSAALGDIIRTRLQGRSPCAQHCSRRVLKQLLGHTVDLDIVACMWVILLHIVKGLQVPVPEDLLEILRLCAEERDLVCREHLKTDPTTGKSLLTKVVNGGSIPEGFATNEFLLKVQMLAKYLRWLACTLLPEVYAACRDDPSRQHPEASTLFYLWTAVEATIVMVWTKYALTFGLSHISLHYDGLRCSRCDLPQPVETFCTSSAAEIKEKTGISVTIVQKKHLNFFEMLGDISSRVEDVSPSDSALLKDGNCLHLALSRLMDLPEEVCSYLQNDSDASNITAVRRLARSVRSVAEAWKVTMVPHMGLHLPADGCYIVLSECDGRPHAVAMRCTQDRAQVLVWNQCSLHHCQLENVMRAAKSSSDYSTVVTFQVFTSAEQATWSEEMPRPTLQTLLDLQAGAGKVARIIKRPAGQPDGLSLVTDCISAPLRSESLSDMHLDESADLFDHEDESKVTVGDTLLNLLDREVTQFKRTIKPSSWCRNSTYFVCALCPFRRFARKARLIQHVHKYHDRRHQFTCSGTKQVKVIAALHDNDRLYRDDKVDKYLSRSAAIMRSAILHAIPDNINLVDKLIRLAFTSGGPIFMDEITLSKSTSFRRCRNLWYDHGFAEQLKALVLVHDAKVRTLLPELVRRTSESGNELSSLFPGEVGSWWSLIEDIFHSPAALQLKKDLLGELVSHEELTSISMDATLRCTLSILGQAAPRATKQEKLAAPVAENESIRRVLTIRGRTGAVCSLQALTRDTASCMATAMRESMTDAARNQVRFVAVDNPSSLMVHELRKVLPNLQFLVLDTVHLPIVYEYGFWRKKTAGSVLLRQIMVKFVAYDSGMDASALGDPYQGADVVNTSPEEKAHRNHILYSSLPLSRARRVVQCLDCSKPFYSRIEYVEALAALAALHSGDMEKMIPGPNRKVKDILWTAASPCRSEWYLNNTRLRLRIPQAWHSLIPSGTTSNESLHAEVNNWFFRGKQSKYV